jgi:DNA ligase-1
MTKIFKPMLAVACDDLSKVNYPVYLSEKLDGIRASIHNGVVMSRSMKPIPSKAVQEKFGKPEYEGFDGEIIYGNKNAKDVFNKSTRVCMSVDLPDDFEVNQIKFFVFDQIGDAPYEERYWAVVTGWPEVTGVYKLRTILVNNADEVSTLERELLDIGAEGVMLRSPKGPYKQGRSTLKEGYLLKVKQFTDSEAKVIGFEEKMHNANEATVGELGQTKRSSHLENMIPMNTLGSLHVRDLVTGVDFHIGTGFNDQQRQEIWDNRESWFGKVVKYSHFEAGAKDKPRFPVFIGERMLEDM